MSEPQKTDRPEPTAASPLRTTALFDAHVELGARMVGFAGWHMPIQYVGLREEHNATRTAIGLFDVSHMGEFRVRGPRSLETLQWTTTNDVLVLKAGDAQYSLFPNEKGGVVDDLIVYCIEPCADYLLCVNAANIDKDWNFIVKNNRGAELINESEKWAQIAIQGPNARDLVKAILDFDLADLKSFQFTQRKFIGEPIWIARTGYTGESGVEVFVPPAAAASLWRSLLERGKALGAQPVGLGARDTLRTEMKYPLYGHELLDETNPYEAGLGWVVKPKAKDFIGRAPMLEYKERGLKRKLVGFHMKDRGIPRQGYRLLSLNGEAIGEVTSGTHSPSLDEPIGIGYVDTRFGEIGSEIAVEIRGKPARALVCATPFVRAKTSDI